MFADTVAEFGGALKGNSEQEIEQSGRRAMIDAALEGFVAQGEDNKATALLSGDMLAGDLNANEKARLGTRLARQKRERDTRVAVEADTNHLIRTAELEAGVNAGAIDEDAIERAFEAGEITPAMRDRLYDRREAQRTLQERRAETVALISNVVQSDARCGRGRYQPPYPHRRA